MTGMSARTGRMLDGAAHLRQSIRDILTTPVGSRVMRRDYGSRLFELVDTPLDGGALVEVYAAVAEALERWEPRFRLTRVQASASEAGTGQVVLDLEGEYLPEGRPVRLEGILA